MMDSTVMFAEGVGTGNLCSDFLSHEHSLVKKEGRNKKMKRKEVGR